MRDLALSAFLAVGLSGCGCGSDALVTRDTGASDLSNPTDGSEALDHGAVAELPCSGEIFAYYEWGLGAESGTTCDIDANGVPDAYRRRPPPGVPALRIFIGGGPTCVEPRDGFPPRPYLDVHFMLWNIDPTTQSSGELLAEEGREGRRYPSHVGDGYQPWAEIGARVDRPGGFECPNADETRWSVSGRWRIVRSGTWGDIFEVEALDVVMAPVDGQQLRFDRMYWRVRLLEPTYQDMAEPTRDGGTP